jgi:nitrogen-specific signal transduction histidine kinase
VRELLFGDQYGDFYHALNASMADGSIRSWSMEITFPDQESCWYDISITPLKGEENLVSSVVIYFHDVSFRVQREEEIRQAGLARLELNMEQFQILNDEIRNPLQVIKGYNLLQGGEFEKKIDEQLEIINELIDKLDRAWVQSEKVHTFLLRHYQHGKYINPDDD